MVKAQTERPLSLRERDRERGIKMRSPRTITTSKSLAMSTLSKRRRSI
jgi:hypothetical protein